jgi:hypothetical protein
MDDDQNRRGRLLLLSKGAALAHRLVRPLAAELDEEEQCSLAWRLLRKQPRRCCAGNGGTKALTKRANGGAAPQAPPPTVGRGLLSHD